MDEFDPDRKTGRTFWDFLAEFDQELLMIIVIIGLMVLVPLVGIVCATIGGNL